MICGKTPTRAALIIFGAQIAIGSILFILL
jgi:hypothetical protein